MPPLRTRSVMMTTATLFGSISSPHAQKLKLVFARIQTPNPRQSGAVLRSLLTRCSPVRDYLFFIALT